MITKDQVSKALGALESHLSDTVVKGGSGDDLGDPEGAASSGGDDSSLKAPGEPMSNAAPKGKDSVKKGDFPPKKPAAAAAKDDDDDDDDDGKSMPANFGKSLPSEITTKVEVSTFLRSLVDHTADSIDGLRDYVAKSDMANENRYDELTAVIDGLQKSQGAIGVVLRAICERIGVVENQPAHVAKSQTSAAPAAAPAPREFVDPNQGATTEAEPQGMFKSLAGKPGHIAKAMVSEVLCDLVRKGDAKDTDVINFETFGFVPPELQAKLSAALN